MLFTQEDYKKIENWLKARAVKDSEFTEASSLDGDDYVVITQDGENKKVTIESIVKTFFGENGPSEYPELIEGFIPMAREFSDDFSNDFTR